MDNQTKLLARCYEHKSMLSLQAADLLFLIFTVALLSPSYGLVSMTDSQVQTLPLDALAVAANAYASANGLQVESKTSDGSSIYKSAPVSLLPNAYPEAAFDESIRLAPFFNEVVDKISRDGDFLKETIGGSVAAADPYTAKLLTLYNKIYLEEKVEAAIGADRLGIHRSDYMLHKDATNVYRIKQVELNTIASSFAGLACKVAGLHSFLIRRYADVLKDFLKANQEIVTGSSKTGFVPENPALERLPRAMHVAVHRYKERHGVTNPCVLFVVQEGETNTVDQRMIEFQLFALFEIPVVRLSLRQIQEQAVLGDDGCLKLPGGEEVAVVYFRAGYVPTDYPDGEEGVEWQARELLERSRATKCPSLGYHLAGTKKVQQELARSGVLERFSLDSAEPMRAAFAGLYSMGDDATSEDLAAVRDVLDGGEGRYVLKPQREGGGHNFYGDELMTKLNVNVQQTDDDVLKLDAKLGEYTLMERLFPPQQKAILLRGGRVEGSGDSISELGCFGTLVVSGAGEVVHNEYAGFLLRTKFSNVDEGGVASGFATLSSPYLC